MQLREMSGLEQQMTEDLEWASDNPEIQQNPDYFGQFVVVYKKKVLGSGTNCPALVQEIARREGIPWRHLVAVIVPRPDVWEIPR